MYLDHFGLDELPFRLVPSPEFYCAAGTRCQVLDALPAILRSGESIVTIVGEAGTGKTLLSRKLVAALRDDYRTVLLSGAALAAGDALGIVLDGLDAAEERESGSSAWSLAGAVFDALGRGPFVPLVTRAVGRAAQILGSVNDLQWERSRAGSPERSLRRIARHVLDLAEQGLGVVVLIDDAHSLSAGSLQVLQLLADLEPEPDRRIQFVLLGLPELSARLAAPPASGLGQRASCSFLLGPLGRGNLEEYVEGRLALAGCAAPNLFSAGALDAVLEATGGVPRLVNVVCHGALTQAWTSGDDQIQRRHVRLAASETDGAHKVPLGAPARAALRAGVGQLGSEFVRGAGGLAAGMSELGRVLLRAARRIRLGRWRRGSVRIKLPNLGPRHGLRRLAKWAAVPLVLLLAAAPIPMRWLVGTRASDASLVPLGGEERLLGDALAALGQDPPFELPAVSKRSRLREEPLASQPAATPEPTPKRVEPIPAAAALPPELPLAAPDERTEPAPAAARPPAARVQRPARVQPKPAVASRPVRQKTGGRTSRAARGRFGMTPHQPDSGAQTERGFRSALRLAEAGRAEEALVALRGVLQVDPDHHRAREALAAVLIRLDRLDEAAGELETGMVLAPGHAPFAKLRARILSKRGTTAEALELLMRSPPSLARDPEYHALIAALYQKQGEHGLAADLYRQVLAAEPQNAAWWMGFGISLEGQDQAGSALLAFRAASALSGLGQEPRRYVESRIASLASDGR